MQNTYKKYGTQSTLFWECLADTETPLKPPHKKGKYSLSLVKFKSNHSIPESQVKLTGILSFGLQAWHVLQEHECKVKVECIQHDEKFKLNS